MRRFLISTKSMPDQAIGEGVVWSNGEVSAKFFYTEPSLQVWPNVKAMWLPGVNIYWIDETTAAPHQVMRCVGTDPPVPVIAVPTHRLQDGWDGANGLADSKGTPLHVGQQVKLLTGGYEGCGDIGEITSFMFNESGKLRICLAGVNCCNMADVDLAEIEALETSTKATAYRHGGRKPSWGFRPAITIGGDDK